MITGTVLTQVFDGLWLLIPVGGIVVIFRTSCVKGFVGEMLVKLAAKLFLDEQRYRRFDNVTLPTQDGSTQIDHIIVSEFGIFVIETKNLRGWIFGSEKEPYWTQQLYGRKIKFQNPLRQNYKHLKTLAAVLAIEQGCLHSLIVFTGGSSFKTPMPENVTCGSGFVDYVKRQTLRVLTAEQAFSIAQTIEDRRLPPSLKTARAHARHARAIAAESQFKLRKKELIIRPTLDSAPSNARGAQNPERSRPWDKTGARDKKGISMNPTGSRSSTTQLSKKLNLPTKQLFGKLEDAGLIERKGETWALTAEGQARGGEYVDSQRFGRYITWPDDFSLESRGTQDKLLSATGLGEVFGIPARRVNQILSEHGWIKKHLKGWLITPLGLRVGGSQRESGKSGVPYVLWPASVLANESLKLTLTELKGDATDALFEETSEKEKSSTFREKLLPKLRTTDGHFVRSRAEMLIDNWLYTAEVVHAYERRLPIEEEAYCDFYLPSGKVYIEFWGMESDPNYVARKKAKLALYEQYGFRLIELHDGDIANLDDVLPRHLLKYDVTTY